MSDSSSNSISRYRSIPYRAPFYLAVIWTLLHWCSIAATITLVGLFLTHTQTGNGGQFKRPIIMAAVSTVITLVLSHYNRRAARCPLCIGTALINTGALTHKRSSKLGPFSEGYTSIISIAVTQKFRCMYCGTRYDLLKTPRRKQHMHHKSDV
jgi:hypothetical protein